MYSINELKSMRDVRFNVSRDDLAKLLGIKVSSLRVYLSNLSSSGLIQRSKKHFDQNLVGTIEITRTGQEKIKIIEEKLKGCAFTPTRHGVDKVWDFCQLCGQYTDPRDRIFILAMFAKNDSFDITDIASAMNLVRNEQSLYRIFRDKFNEKNDESEPFNRAVYNMSIYGLKDKNRIENIDEIVDDVDTLLLIAESTRRRGNLGFSLAQYNKLLSPRFNLTENQWFQTNIGIAYVLEEMGEIDQAAEMIEKLIGFATDNTLRTYLREIRGLFHYFKGEYKESISDLSYCIRSFGIQKDDYFLTISCNNRGVVYFNSGKTEIAEKDWKKALKHAKKIKSKYMEASILPNLADIESGRGNLQKAERYLRIAQKYFEEYNSNNGRSVVEFNKALLYLEKGVFEKAVDHFMVSEYVAAPLPSPSNRKIRRDWFLKKAEEKGFVDVKSYLNRRGFH
ncbi:MAG: tetratricopeptide repeat protein [Candidatus Hodarchaeales archaeon]